MRRGVRRGRRREEGEGRETESLKELQRHKDASQTLSVSGILSQGFFMGFFPRDSLWDASQGFFKILEED